jgi:ferredoxin
MSTRIYWFSGTGNSLWAARRIASALGDAELVRITADTPMDLPAAERVGVVFPVYAWGPPRMVAEFLDRVPVEDGAYVFAVATFGGHPGATINAVERRLGNRGLSLDAGYTMRMIENYPPMGGAPDEATRRERFQAAEKRIDEIAGEIASGERGYIERGFFLYDLVGRAIWKPAMKSFRKGDKKFFTDDKCTSCGVCSRVCPAGDIEIAGGAPTWKGDCAACFACMFWCPEKAIHFGKVREKLVHYHHPDVSLDEMLTR